MYQIKIKKTIEDKKEKIIINGESFVDENNEVIFHEVPVIKNKGTPDETVEMSTVEQINDSGKDMVVMIFKSAQEIADEKQSLIDSKVLEIQTKLDEYKAAQEYQKQNGGPGPVAEEEIMKIANEYNGQFEVILEE